MDVGSTFYGTNRFYLVKSVTDVTKLQRSASRAAALPEAVPAGAAPRTRVPTSPAETFDVPCPGAKGFWCQDIWEPLRFLAGTRPVFCFSSFVRGSGGKHPFRIIRASCLESFCQKERLHFTSSEETKPDTRKPQDLLVSQENCAPLSLGPRSFLSLRRVTETIAYN